MSDNFFERAARESDAQYILRLYLDPWFEDVTPSKLADFTGLQASKVRRVLFAWIRSSNVRRIHSHASAIAEQIGWAGTAEGLVHTALELLLQRAQRREKLPRVNIDAEIKHFLARNRVKSDIPPSRELVLAPDTEPGNV